MSLFVRPRLSSLAVAAVALLFAFLLRNTDSVFAALALGVGVAEVGLAVWNPQRRRELAAQAEAAVQAEAQKLLAPVESKASSVLAEAKTLASQAQSVEKTVQAEVQNGLAEAQKVLSPTEKIAADIADELKKA